MSRRREDTFRVDWQVTRETPSPQTEKRGTWEGGRLAGRVLSAGTPLRARRLTNEPLCPPSRSVCQKKEDLPLVRGVSAAGVRLYPGHRPHRHHQDRERDCRGLLPRGHCECGHPGLCGRAARWWHRPHRGSWPADSAPPGPWAGSGCWSSSLDGASSSQAGRAVGPDRGGRRGRREPVPRERTHHSSDPVLQGRPRGGGGVHHSISWGWRRGRCPPLISDFSTDGDSLVRCGKKGHPNPELSRRFFERGIHVPCCER